MYKIMVIEDDARLKSIMADCLAKYGYEVAVCEDFKTVEQQFDAEKPDMAVLDVNLPYFDGFYLCRVFRRKSKIPILIVSARSGDMEQVMGMELGADDYIVKPFGIELFLARVKSALRRAYGEYSDAGVRQAPAAGGILLDEGSFKMLYGGHSAELSKNEYKLLKKLLENHGKIVPREELLAELWDDSSFVDDNTLTVNVTRVKARLGELGLHGVIRTKRGTGYILDTASNGDDAHE